MWALIKLLVTLVVLTTSIFVCLTWCDLDNEQRTQTKTELRKFKETPLSKALEENYEHKIKIRLQKLWETLWGGKHEQPSESQSRN